MKVRPQAACTRHTLRDLLRSFYVISTLLLGLAALVILAGPFLFLAALTFDPHRRLARRATRLVFSRLIRHYCFLAGNPFILESPLDLPALGPCIVVANHVSAMDSVVLMQLPPGLGDGRIWAKSWPFRKPLLGPLMKLSGHLRVDDFNLLPTSKDLLSDGQSMLVFPESSRSRNGRLLRFRDGAFLLAARTNLPILPVAIHGTFHCMPPGKLWIHRPKLKLQVLGLLRADPSHPRPHLLLKQQAHAMIATALQQGSPEEVPAAAALSPAPPTRNARWKSGANAHPR